MPPLETGNTPLVSVEFKLIAPLFNSPLTLLTMPVPKEDRLVEPVAETLNRTLWVEDATWKTSRAGEVEVPSTTKVALGVVEPMPTLWLAVTLKTEIPDEEEMLNGSKAPVPWMLKETVEEVALAPATVPLSIKMPVVKAVEDAQIAA